MLDLRKEMLAEFSKATFKGFEVVDFWVDAKTMRFIIEAFDSTIAFTMKDGAEFNVLSVVGSDQVRIDESDLYQFEAFVAEVAAILKPTLAQKMAEYEALTETIEYREEQATLKEEYLSKRALSLEARAQLLDFQMQAIDVESQFLAQEKAKNEAQRVRRWTRENRYALRWVAIGIIVITVLFILILI